MEKEPSRTRGRKAAKEVAKKLGGRKSRSGRRDQPDIEGPWFVGEVSSYQKAPDVPYHNLKRIKLLTRGSNKMPIFVFQRPEWGEEYVVAILLDDFKKWWGKIEITKKENTEREGVSDG